MFTVAMHRPVLGHAFVFFFFFFLAPLIACANVEDEAEPMPGAFGRSGSVHVASAHGALGDSLTIAVAPGRRQMEPSITLSYSSGGGNGILGLGWQMDLGRVERWRGEGTPAANASDSYFYSLVGSGGELVSMGNGVYRAKSERAYREYSREDEAWVMRNGEGFTHRFGTSPQSRLDGQRWLLDQVEDAYGNTINYGYAEIGGKVYPGEIRYTGYAPDDDLGAHSVVFEYEGRPDVRSQYSGYVQSGTELLEYATQRLRSITVLASGALVRRYEFEYEPHPLNGQSMLTRIVLVGADNHSRVTLKQFEYSTREPGWGDGAEFTQFPVDLADGDGKDTGARVLDVNGDTYADVLDTRAGEVWLGDGSGGFEKSIAWSTSLATVDVRLVDEDGVDTGARLIDVDTNGFPDFFIASSERREIWLNDGLGWQKADAWTLAMDALDGPVYVDPDFSGEQQDCTVPHCDGEFGLFDGCTPPHCTGSDDDPPDCVPPECAPGEEEGCLPPECDYVPVFSQEADRPLTLIGPEGDSQGVLLADVNGDGRIDVVWSMRSGNGLYYHVDRSPVSVRSVYLNTGSGWQRHPGLSAALTGIEHFVEDGHVNGYQLVDVNGDGLADIVRTGKRGENEEARIVYLGTGHGWKKDLAFTQSLIDEDISSLVYAGEEVRDRGLTLGELNDDGLVDYVLANDEEVVAFRNTGLGWIRDPVLTALFSDHDIKFTDEEGTESAGVIFANIDGDGIPDLVAAKDENRQVHYSRGMRSGLMVKATNALGEVANIEWGLSAQDDHRDATGVERLPFNMPVVRSIELDFGHGSTYTTSFEYEGGLFESRQFRGFRKTVEYQPSGISVHTSHNQSPDLAGLPSQVLIRDSSGKLLERHLTDYQVVAAAAPVMQIQPTLVVQELYEAGQVRRTITEHSYDALMNPVSTFKDPEEGVPGDEQMITTQWIIDKSAGIWSLPSRTSTYGPGGQLLHDSLFEYDNLPEGKATRGAASRVRDLVEGTTYVSRTMEYDRYGNVTRFGDRSGEQTEFEYDTATASYRTQATDPEGRTVHTTVDPRFGKSIEQSDVGGNVTRMHYDAFGRLVKLVLPGDEVAANGTRTYDYSEVGDPGAQHFLLSETRTADDPETLDARFYFDAAGNIYRIERLMPSGPNIVTTKTFDDKGNPLTMSQPHFEGEPALLSVITRDQLRRPVRISDPDGYETRFTYAGARVDYTDKSGQTTSYWRNIDGKITRIAQWVGGEEQVTRYAYDAVGRLVEVVDAVGGRTAFGFNALGRRTWLSDPNVGDYLYKYDDAGRLISQLAPGGEVTRFRYNRAGNLMTKQFPDGTEVRYHYGQPGSGNGAGKIVRIEDEAGTVEVSYDARGNVIKRVREVEGTRFVTGYAFDSINRLRRVSYPDGFQANYHYNDQSYIDRVTDGDGQPIAYGFEYNAAGQLLGMTYGNGVQSVFAYGAMTEMTDVMTVAPDGDLLQDLAYRYSPMGNIEEIDDGVTQLAQTFEYDEAGRLIQASGIYGDRVYEYDAIGNLLRKNDLEFEMDPAHPQRVVRAHYLDDPKPAKRAFFEIEYDARGNVIAKADQRFEYTAENRMSRTLDQKGKLLSRNVYDSAGHRVVHETRSEKTVYIDGIYERGKTHDSRHVYAGPMLLSTVMTPRSTVHLVDDTAPPFLGCATPYDCGDGYRLASEHPLLAGLGGALCVLLLPLFAVPAGTRRRVGRELLQTGRNLREQPLHGLVIAIVLPVFLVVTIVPAHAAPKSPVEPVGQTSAEKRYYYHSNHLGSVNVVTDQEGKVVERRDYTPYGEKSGWTGPNEGPRELLDTFNGQRYDDDSGLYYFGARYYDAELGRFLSADSLVPEPMDPKTLNRYAFAKGNPVRFSDPTGHSAIDIVFWVLVGIAAVVLLVLSVIVTALSWGTLGWLGALMMGGFFLLVVGAIGFAAGLTLAAGFGLWYKLSAGDSGTREGLIQAMYSGFLLGVVVTLGIAAFIIGFIPIASSVGSFCAAVFLGAVVGAGVGGLATTITHFVKGKGPDDLFWSLVSGVAWGAAFGAATGVFQGAISGSLNFIFDPGSALGMGNTTFYIIDTLIIGGLFTAGDVIDSFVLANIGYGHSVSGLAQAFISSIIGLTAVTIFDADLTLTDSEPWEAFFGSNMVNYFYPQPLSEQ